MISEQQKRVIRENPHLQAGKLANFLGITADQVANQRRGKRTWSYTGVSIPFMRFDKLASSPGFRVKYKMTHIFGGNFKDAINHQGQLLWLLERGLCPFGLDNKPIFLQNLKFGE